MPRNRRQGIKTRVLMAAPATVAMVIQKSGDVAPGTDKKGTAQADKPHVLGEEIKAQSQKGINAGRA